MKKEEMFIVGLNDLLDSPPTSKSPRLSLILSFFPPSHTSFNFPHYFKMADPQKHLQGLSEEYQKLQSGIFPPPLTQHTI